MCCFAGLAGILMFSSCSEDEMQASDDSGLESLQSTDSGITQADATELVDATASSTDSGDAGLEDAETVAFECPVAYGISLEKDEAEAMHGLPCISSIEQCGFSDEKTEAQAHGVRPFPFPFSTSCFQDNLGAGARGQALPFSLFYLLLSR